MKNDRFTEHAVGMTRLDREPIEFEVWSLMDDSMRDSIMSDVWTMVNERHKGRMRKLAEHEIRYGDDW